MKSGAYLICRILILTAPRVAKVEEGKIVFGEMNNAGSRVGPESAQQLSAVGCLHVLFHVSVLNVERSA
jgi:hypothetical protein